MNQARIGFALVLVGLSMSPCEGAQTPDVLLRTVDVSGSSTRVMTVGLRGREPGQPVLLLFSGGERGWNPGQNGLGTSRPLLP